MFVLPLACFSASQQELRDPYYRESLYYEYLSDSVMALAHLEAAQQRHQLQQDPGATEAGIARQYENMGMPRQASEHYLKVSGRVSGQDAGQNTARNRTAAVRAEAWYRVAQDAYRRGDYARADQAIARIGHGLPPQLEASLPLFHALVLLKSGRNREAGKILDKEIKLDKFDAWESYNLGVAKLRSGDLPVGAGLIDRVGAMPAGTEEMLALRDQANLALGYAFLRADLGATARPLFRRVRLDGPYSSRALLGLGWSELAPDGAQQKSLDVEPIRCTDYHPDEVRKQVPEYLLQGRDYCNPVKDVSLQMVFEMDPGGKTSEERSRRALRAWQVLIERDPADPAVQEALLAVAYVDSVLGMHEQAIEQYRHAIDIYVSEQGRLDRLERVVRSEPITSNNVATLWTSFAPGDSSYLADTFTSPAFAAAFEDYRDLQVLNQSLDRAAGNLDQLSPPQEVASPEVETAAGNQESQTRAGQSAEGDQPRTEKLYLGVDPLIGAIGTGGNASKYPDRSLVPASLQGRELELRSRFNNLHTQLAAATKAQESAIRALALRNLEARRTFLETYLAQARFSLARLLDPGRASTRTSPADQ